MQPYESSQAQEYAISTIPDLPLLITPSVNTIEISQPISFIVRYISMFHYFN